jgi:hypothetical protein
MAKIFNVVEAASLQIAIIECDTPTSSISQARRQCTRDTTVNVVDSFFEMADSMVKATTCTLFLVRNIPNAPMFQEWLAPTEEYNDILKNIRMKAQRLKLVYSPSQ